MSIRLVAEDVDLEEGVMLRPDYITYADTSDCLVSFSSNPHTVARVRYNLVVSFVRYNLTTTSVRYDLTVSFALLCTISISEPLILRHSVLGEFRSLST